MFCIVLRILVRDCWKKENRCSSLCERCLSLSLAIVCCRGYICMCKDTYKKYAVLRRASGAGNDKTQAFCSFPVFAGGAKYD